MMCPEIHGIDLCFCMIFQPRNFPTINIFGLVRTNLVHIVEVAMAIVDTGIVLADSFTLMIVMLSIVNVHVDGVAVPQRARRTTFFPLAGQMATI